MAVVDVIKLGARHIDSFQVAPPRPGSLCSFKDCRKAGRIFVYYTLETPHPLGVAYESQKKDRVCVKHALDLANDVLSVFKFRIDELTGD